MYASYYYTSTSTVSQILSDTVALLTGETTVANLSASCNKTLTTITASARVAGWTLHDASAGTNAQCLKAAIADNASQYKYMVIDTNTAGYILTKLYENWNATTHTGTNLASGSATTTVNQSLFVSKGGRLEISASARHALFYNIGNLTGFGNETAFSPSGIVERTRRSPWDTVANGYLPALFVCQFNFNTYNYECRYPAPTGVISSSCYMFLSQPFAAGNTATLPNTRIPFGSTPQCLQPLQAIYPLNVAHPANAHMGGEVSPLCDIYLYSYSTGAAPLDTVMYNSNEYIVWGHGTTYRFIIRKG